MNRMELNQSPQPYPTTVDVPPQEDARLPIYEAKIEAEWAKWRPKYTASLKAAGTFTREVKATALQCIQLLQEYQKRNLGPDMGREAVQELIVPQPEM